MTAPFEVHEMDSFIALDVLRPFMKRASSEPEFTNSHSPQPVRFDESVTMKFEGAILRNGGEDALVFLALKQGVFAIWIVMPCADGHLPTLTIFGDVAQARSFLSDLRAHHQCWLECEKAA